MITLFHIFGDFFFFLGGLSIGRFFFRKRQYQHKHAWEVVDKTVVQGTSLDDAIKVAQASDYSLTMGQIMGYVEPEGMIVHYRCPCGEEKVVRV